MSNLSQNLVIRYRNQKERELKLTLFNPLDKVLTLASLANELFEKYSFKNLLNPIIATSFIYKTIKTENIEYFDFIGQDSDTLDLLYDFILKINASNVELLQIFEPKKFEAIKILNDKYIEFKDINNFVDINDIFKFAIKNIDKYNFTLYNEIYIDQFELENIKFYKSNLELELLNILKSISKPIDNIKKQDFSAKLYQLEKQAFDINDEVQAALKLSRKILEENDNLCSNDICIVTTDIGEYAPVFRLYLQKYELKGYDSKGKSLCLFEGKKSSDIQVLSAFSNVDKQIKSIKYSCQKLNINIDTVKLKDKLIKNTFILEDKIGIQLTEANQLLGLNKTYEHIIFIGTDINHFPPKRSDNFLYTSEIAQEFFCENNYYESSLLQYNELKRLTNNLYILSPKYKEKRELSPSIIIDKNIPNIIDISNIKSKKQKNENQEYLDSILSCEFTKFDGLDVSEVFANHLSASQLSSYAKCALKYLYTYRLRIKVPRDDEDGFDPAEQGTLMHSCFEKFAKKVQGDKNLSIEEFKSIMYEILEEEYILFLNDPNNKIKEENIYHQIYKYTLAKGLKDDKVDGLLIKFINYYEQNKEELNYFINSEFEKEFALDNDLKPYKLLDSDDKNYFIKGYIDRFDNLKYINIVDYKSKKASGVLQEKLDEIRDFKDFQLGLYTLYSSQEYKKDIDAYLLTFKSDNKLYSQFARVSNNIEFIPQNRGKDIGVLYDEAFEKDLKENIINIKNKIEQGDFRFDSSDEKYCGYCEVKFMCNKSILNKINKDEK